VKVGEEDNDCDSFTRGWDVQIEGSIDDTTVILGNSCMMITELLWHYLHTYMVMVIYRQY